VSRAISVVGLGYIGLPLSLTFSEKGFRVIGVDVNKDLVSRVNSGHTSIHEDYYGETLETVLQRNLARHTFTATLDIAEAAKEADAYVVTVGIPVDSHGQLDDTPILKAAAAIGRVIKPGNLVIFRSTVIPGVLEAKVIPILAQASGMEPGVDFHVAYAPERVAEGRAIVEFQTLDVVVAGLTDACADRAEELLGQLTSGQLHRTSLRIAQAVKVIENAQRDVNIALAQEVARFAEFHGVDVNELIRMANTHPRVKLLTPDIGVGGFCIPNAYPYMQGSLQANQVLPLFDLARRINHDVPNHMVNRLASMLEAEGKMLSNSTIAVLGLGMKDFSNDIRLSPAIDVIAILQEQGATVKAFDPTVDHVLSYQSNSLVDCLKDTDGLVVGAWQHEFESMDFTAAFQHSHVKTAIIDMKRRLRLVLQDKPGTTRVYHGQ